MEFYTQDVFNKARNLKQQGVATGKIVEQLGITRETLSRWCFDIPSTNPNRLRSQKIKLGIRGKAEENINGLVIHRRQAKIFAALIYWCEGYKYPNCNCIGFANSDIFLIRAFLELFRLGFNPKEEKFRVHLQLHDTHDRKEITSSWSNLLRIPESQFYKPTITKAQEKMKRRDYRGTCTVKYYDVALYNELVGTYEAFFKKFLRI